VRSTNHQTPYYAVFFSFLSGLPLRTKYLLQHLICKHPSLHSSLYQHPEHMFFHEVKRLYFAPIMNSTERHILELLLGSHVPKWNLHSSFVGCPSLSPPNRSIELGSLQAAWLCRAPGPGLALMLVHILATASDSPEHIHMKIMLSSVTLLVPSLRHLFSRIYIYSQ
jgi:hypothetical protein